MRTVKVYSMKLAFNDLKRCPYCHFQPSIRVFKLPKDFPIYRISCGVGHKLGRVSVDDYSLKSAVIKYNDLVDSLIDKNNTATQSL